MLRLVLLSLFFYTAYGANCGTGIYDYGTWDSSAKTFTVTSNIPDFANFASPFYDCQIEEGTYQISVVVSDSVTSIGNNAFRKQKITELTIGNSVTSIGDNAFRDNYQLTGELNIPDSVTSIGIDAFKNNALTSVTIHGLNVPGAYGPPCECLGQALLQDAQCQDLKNEYNTRTCC